MVALGGEWRQFLGDSSIDGDTSMTTRKDTLTSEITQSPLQ